ncbi:phosphoglycerate dehydrogenase-like enzyme [Natronocella acetinitrilica]|uniref:Phosphoglycerate dehydrogenase-like enzyme n=1 Tax=Natronocella acetinitrilica TaxID=414046 RepID=A0AAE3KBH7_9GAMM|nr:D-2-hydroxyacid dehydrogenase [Natronocella acetinitrilica]MCP1675560.1 phosphoglycerate dehydrogenase-like enzyme [Natronocella acetinitrilica]
MTRDILLLTDEAARYAEALEERGLNDVTLHVAESLDELDDQALAAPVALGKPALLCKVIDRMPALEWVQSTFAGVDALLDPALRRDYRLTGVKGVFGPLMSEYVLGQIIAVERDFRRMDRAQAAARWEPFPYSGLRGRTMGIAGLGSIGRDIAATARHFGMRVLGYKRSPGEVEGVDAVYAGADFAEFAAAVDYLVLVMPATAETEHVINATTLSAMKPSAWLINVGRGALVNEAALAEALEQRRIGGAILDVFEEEPLPGSSSLWKLSNVVITPHVAAESFPEDIAGIFADNWQRFQGGKPLLYEIDFERGY